MYIPKHFRAEDEEEALDFMKAFGFATIVTANAGQPLASHLPFTVKRKAGKIVLGAHFARANPQWENLLDSRVLVIFNEPHAYISPRFYDREQSVPTWNYVAVHAYGSAVMVSETEAVTSMLEEMILLYEPDYKLQWDGLPAEFKEKMIKGIVAFEVEVDELQVAKKLSQNKNSGEQKRIAEALAASEQQTARMVGDYMLRNLTD